MSRRLSRSQRAEAAEYEEERREVERRESMSTGVAVVEEVQPSLVPRQQAGMLAMAMLPQAEFDARLKALKAGQERIRTIKKELMQEDSHYGVIPHTNKPSLLKPGAEVLCSIYGLRADFIPRVEYGDGLTAPPVRVTMRCELHLGDLTGPVVAVGVGAANSWERKYRYRGGERSCPECGVVGSVIKGKEDFGGGWLCWGKKGGCGVKWPDGDPAIEAQEVGKVENPDQHDLENTLLKMAKKRAHVDAALTGTASSDLFTQDVEENEPPPPPKTAKPAKAQPPPQREPGEDETPEEVYDRIGVDPPEPAPAPRRAPRDGGPQAGGHRATCPHCGKSVGPSKFPKPGKTHYCYDCKATFDPDEGA